MKKIKSICIILTTVFMLINIKTVYAASSISFSSSSPKVGESLRVTVSVPNVNTVDLKATVSGCGTNGTIQIVDVSMTGNPKTFSGSVTVTPTSTGTITVAISDSSNAVLNGSYVSVGGSRKITVSNKQSSSNSSSSSSNNSTSSSNTTTTQEPEVKKSSEKNLSSLSVSEGTLSPKFSSGTTTYKVDLTSETESLTISAKAKDSKAKVSGTGKKELKIGENNFTVTVTAEDGSKKTYTISVYVTEKPTQFVKLGDQNLGILNDLSKTDVPKGFEKSTIKIDNKDVTALQNKDMGLTLLYLQNEDDSTGFYIYDVDNNKVLSKYQTVAVNGKTYVLMDAPDNLEAIQDLKTATIKIGDVELSGWKFEDEALSYEDTEGTLQKYTPVEEENDNTLTYVFIGTTALFVVSTAVLGYMYISFKKKSISAIKDYYERKNQG